MDCCNYMPYRHHQYYGSQYYEPAPSYHGDFYGHQLYQDYYGNPLYHQQWPCAASFPDYVYNPKEARIRKAMRDATRERSIGTSPMLQRPNARRASSSHSWVPPQHDDLMMSPMGSMQAASVCGFPMPSSAGSPQQFMGAMNAYNKLEAAPPPPMPPSSTPVHTNYMQSNPLAQLQQHTEMWPEYSAMRPRSSGNPFMMGDVPSFPSQPPEVGASLMMEKEPTPAASPPSNEAEPDKEQEHFIPVFESSDETKMKKPPTVAQLAAAGKKPATKPLPDFNEAFGSTERGRFQSPPDPRLAPNKSYLDYFFDSAPIKFDDYQI